MIESLVIPHHVTCEEWKPVIEPIQTSIKYECGSQSTYGLTDYGFELQIAISPQTPKSKLERNCVPNTIKQRLLDLGILLNPNGTLNPYNSWLFNEEHDIPLTTEIKQRLEQIDRNHFFPNGSRILTHF